MTNPKPTTIKKYVSSLESVTRSKSNDTLGSVLSRVRSSHEAIFIFNEQDEFLGLVSPFQTLFSRNYPYTTKVSSIVFQPPLITESTEVYLVAKHMLATKIYVLPVFDENKEIKSVVYAKEILQKVNENPSLLEFVSDNVSPHTPITTATNTSVKDVFYDLRERGVSKVIVVDDEGGLVGVATRSDLMQSLIKPTAKMRFPKEGTDQGYYSLAGEKKFRKTESIGEYFTSLVDSLPNTTPSQEIVRHLITSPHNNIVLVDKQNKPTGFLSTRDLLKALTLLRPKTDVPITFKKPSENVSEEEFDKTLDLLEKFGKKLSKRMELEQIDLVTDEPKNAKGHTKMYNTTLVVTPVTGKSLRAVTKQREYIDGVQEAIKLIEKQRKRTGLSKDGSPK